MKQIITVLVEDKYGALSRIIEIFSSRSYNLDSICSGESVEEGTHRLTLVCFEDYNNIQHILKLLRQLVNVHDAQLLDKDQCIHRELILFKLEITPVNRNDLLTTIRALQANILALTETYVCFELLSNNHHINLTVKHLYKNYNILEISRTGEAALPIEKEEG